MKEQYENIEPLAKAAAEKVHIPFDDMAWHKMEAMLNKEEDRKPAFIWWNAKMLLFSFVTLLGVGMGIYYFTSTSSKNKLAQTTTSTNTTLPNNNNSTAEVKQATTTTTIVDENTNNNLIQNNSVPDVIENTNNNTNKVIDNKSNEATEISNINKENNYSSNSIKPNINSTSNTIAKAPLKSTEKNNIGLNKLVKNNNNFKKKKNKEISKTEGEEVQEEERAISSTVVNEKNVVQEKELTIAPVENLPEAKRVDEKPIINPTEKDTLPKIFTKEKRIGPKPNRFLQNLSIAAITATEINTVKFKETKDITAQYGIAIQYNIGKKWALGIQFLKGNKKYSTDKSGYSYAPGSYWSTIGSFTVDATCNMIDIPIVLTYFFANNAKNSFYTRAGLTSYILKQEDYVYQYKQYGIPYTKTLKVVNENKHSFSNLNLSLGYQFKLHKKVMLNAEPYIKIPINGVGAGKVELTSIGTLIGISYAPWRK